MQFKQQDQVIYFNTTYMRLEHLGDFYNSLYMQ